MKTLFTSTFLAFCGVSALASLLPEGYTQLQYIESTKDGKQWIDTGYLSKSDDRFDMILDVAPGADQNPGFPAAFGFREANEYKQAFLAYHSSIQKAAYDAGRTASGQGEAYNQAGAAFAYSKKMYLVCRLNVARYSDFGGTSLGSISIPNIATYPEPTVTCGIFGAHDGYGDQSKPKAWQPAVMKLYAFTITDASGEVQCRFVPCKRNSDDKPGVYDLKRGGFYSNSNPDSSADFTMGPVYSDALPTGYQQLKFIESTGTQWIDTNYKPLGVDLHDMVVDVLTPQKQTSAYPNVFGWHDGSKPQMAFDPCPNKTTTADFMVRGDNQNVVGGGFLMDERMHLTCGQKTATWSRLVDGYSTGSITAANSVTDAAGTLYIFAAHNYTKTDSLRGNNPIVMRLYSYRIYDTSAVQFPKHDYVPCRNAAGVVGVYDKVTGAFIGSDTDTAFVAAPEDGKAEEGYELYKNLKTTAPAGEQTFVDTVYYAKASDEYVLDLNVAPSSAQTAAYPTAFGWRKKNYTHTFMVWHKDVNGADYAVVSDNTTVSGSAFPYDRRVTLTCTPQKAQWLSADGQVQGSITAARSSELTNSGTSIFVFASHNRYDDSTDNAVYPAAMTLHSFKIYSEGQETLKHHYVPCKKLSDGTVGLYDLVDFHFRPAVGSFTVAHRAEPCGLVLIVK